MPRRVYNAALLAGSLHGLLVLTARYRLSYDAYNHMFFGDHYLRHWWSLWDERWYTGFSVASYPPLVHQLIALLGRVTGVDAAFGLILWATLAAYPFAVYAFTRVFTGRDASSYAAYAAALLPSIFLSAHVFGQLPTLVAMLLALFAMAVLADFLKSGGFLTGAVAIGLFASMLAAHHATLLAVPWMAGAVIVHLILKKRTAVRQLFARLVIFVPLALIAGWLVIFPFWQWGAQQSLQTPIDHLSRSNFFQETLGFVLFFLPVYGLLIPLIPALPWIARRKLSWGLHGAFYSLFFLGLGGTTPLPRLLFGEAWTWLTFDRFAFWASILLLPYFGVFTAALRRRLAARQERRRSTGASRELRSLHRGYLAAMAFIALLIGLIPGWLPTQPAQLDMQPVIEFLAEKERSGWRYVTFGFGDQLAYLSRLTSATTIDGSYHTARTLPELRTSGIGQIDTAYWVRGGMDRLDPILQRSALHGVRWAFVNMRSYVPILRRNGWFYFGVLQNGVQIWKNPAAEFPEPAAAPVSKPVASFAWGVFPFAALSLTGALALRRYREEASRRVMVWVQAFAIGLLPLGLTLWYFRKMIEIPQERIYFTYSDALFFASDGLALVGIAAWLIRKVPDNWLQTSKLTRSSVTGLFKKVDGWLFLLLLLITVSIAWSQDWRTSLYVSLHGWLAFGLFLSIRSSPRAWRWFGIGCLAALFLQSSVAAVQFLTQSTEITRLPGMEWPGSIEPSLRGASVVQLTSGARWLRAYGTFPHPNILGGFSLTLFAAALPVVFSTSRWRWLVPLSVLVATPAIALSFSRSAWLGALALGMGLLYFYRRIERKKLIALYGTTLLAAILMILPLRAQLMTRLGIGGQQVQTEQVSIYTRSWLINRSLEIVGQNPLLGVGAGGFSLALSRHVASFYDIEPVHNVPLLALSELGIVGLALISSLALTMILHARHIRYQTASLFSAALIGISCLGIFDHYFWTLAPGRILYGAMLGLWAAQVDFDEIRH